LETALEIPPDAAAVQQTNGVGNANLLPKRSKTRQGKPRLLTLDSLDARSAAYADACRLIENLLSDLGGDPSAGERQLVTRAVMTGAIAADFETRWVAGQAITLGEYLATVNTQRRALVTLGLERRARDIGPTLSDILRPSS
jgi:hypothetical protein